MQKDVSRLVFDIISAVILLAVALGGSYFPRYLAKRGRAAGNERGFGFQLGNMLSAGVMISAGFCHLLADAVDETVKAVPDFPLATFLCAFGFLITLSADQYAIYVSKNRYPNEPSLLPSTGIKSDEPSTSAGTASRHGNNATVLAS